jgi:glyoxylase-like metal-dependent hydrolase (beta-lactamase superfamily II)
MNRFPYTKGWHDLGGGCYAYLQPDGSWGLNNAGLIRDGSQGLLVDTLYDLNLTGEMLAGIPGFAPGLKIDTLVNTHANGDHTFGNEKAGAARIVATKACAEEFSAVPPAMMAGLLQSADALGPMGAYFKKAFGRYDYQGITLTPPTQTFEGQLNLKVGSVDVQVIEVGPTHTLGDAIVYVPQARIVFAGDMLFIGGTPLLWTGPVENWVRALDRMMEFDADLFVPGHGPITDKAGVAEVKAYWETTRVEARRHFDAGRSLPEAAAVMMAGPYRHWTDPERIGVTLGTLYRQFQGDSTPGNAVEAFGLMAQLAGL